MQTETSRRAEGSNSSSSVLCENRLSAVFDYSEIIFAGYIQNAVHIARPASEMNRQDCASPSRDGSNDFGRINIVIFSDIHENRRRAQNSNTAGRGNKRIRHSDNFVARTYTQTLECKQKSVCSGGHTYR